MIRYNEPGAPTNIPQQILDERPLPSGGDVDRGTWLHRPTRSGTTAAGLDVADPHPSDEERYGLIQRPGGARPPRLALDIGPNPWAHDGNPIPRPRQRPGRRRRPGV
ncbi:MAG TPA: hypothetical protein GYA10_02160 [Alphaproteobacteria bacterium]|nr:hypothetical protein [Alphaproteobacteria bacterium]